MVFHDLQKSVIALSDNIGGEPSTDHSDVAVPPVHQMLQSLTDAASLVGDHTGEIESGHTVVDQNHSHILTLELGNQFRLSVAAQNDTLNLLGLSGTGGLMPVVRRGDQKLVVRAVDLAHDTLTDAGIELV